MKQKKLLRRVSCAATLMSLLLGTLQPARAQDITSIIHFNLSNDGKLVGFATQGGVGLYDWRAGTITKIEDPPGDHTATLPAFATDGKSFHMGFQRGGRYGLFDLSSLQLKATYSNECPASARPVLQQGDKAALTIVATFPNKLCLFDFETKSIRIVLPEAEGFSRVRNPSFVGLDEILFIGQGTRNRELTTKVKALGADPVTADIPYRLKFGGRPEIAFPEILERSRALMSPLGPEGPTGMVASRNGEKIVYIDRSLSEEARKEEARKHPKKYGEPHRYDLFVIDHGITRQVTHLEAYMSFQAISYDGSTAALGLSIGPMTKESYLSRPSRAFEPVIVDLNTGVISRTDLVARVNADPRFSTAKVK